MAHENCLTAKPNTTFASYPNFLTLRNTEPSPLERLFAHLKDYLNFQKKLLLTTVSKKGGDAVYVLVLAITLFMIGWFFLLIFSMGVGFGLAALLNSLFWGFMIVAGLYLLAGILIWTNRERVLKGPIVMSFLKFVDTPKAQEQDEQEQK